jgi:predicted transposase/invertase (TIGR01784 family)
MWCIFVVDDNSAFAKKIEEKYLMLVMTCEQFQRAYPEALKREYQEEATVKATVKATLETSIEIATRMLSDGMSINKVVKLTKLSREKVVALKAQLKAGSQGDSPAPAAS